jgi:hypothetical protein
MTTLRGHTVQVLEGKRVFLKDRDSRKSYYDLRHGESDWTLPLTVERVVWANFYGTLVSDSPVYALENKNRFAHIKLTKAEGERLMWDAHNNQNQRLSA